MLPFPEISPTAIQIGPVAIRWYGLMYVVGAVLGYVIISARLKHTTPQVGKEHIQGFILWTVLGLMIGGRLGYLAFYQWPNWVFYLRNPLEIVAIWHGGMSFHGGLVGGITSGFYYLHRRRLPSWKILDAVCLALPWGLMAGRIGNFINGELFGRVSDAAWAMVSPLGGPLPRHPSQLYEAILEGPVLFLFLWALRHKSKPGQLAAWFLMAYAFLRFLVEFMREPDPQIGLLFASLTMGQYLCLGQFVIGVIIWLARDKTIVNCQVT